jgi:hypothetical protein
MGNIRLYLRTGFFLFLMVVVMTVLTATQKEPASKDSDPCALVRQALVDSGRIKSGMTRREVEKYFSLDGGMLFAEKTRYVYSKCQYIKIEIDFSRKPSGKELFSPNDIVVNAARPYIEYPAKD